MAGPLPQDMLLDESSDTLSCSVCGEDIDDTGYVPAIATDDDRDPVVADAVCGACGFADVGMTGCAPEFGEVGDPETADVLLFVRRTDGEFEIVSEKE